MDLVRFYMTWFHPFCTHARTQTIFGSLESSIYGGHFGRITFLQTVDHMSVGPSGGRERKGEKGEAMRVKKRIVCKKNRLID